MTSMEIPKVESLADVGDPLENIVKVVHFLLSALLARGQALLHSEYRCPALETVWYLRCLRPLSNESEGEDEILAVLPSAVLQSFIGRLSVMLGLHPTEGGEAKFTLSQSGRKHLCRVVVSNRGESGRRIRVYGKAV